MKIQSTFDTFIEAAKYLSRGPSPEEILILVVIAFLFSLGVIIPFIYMRISKERELKNLFFSQGKDYGLSEEEVELLWKYVQKLPIDPLIIFEKKVIFERVVDKIVRNGDFEEIKKIPIIRMKLRFDNLPWFIPLSTTRDIDVYQTGSLTVRGYETQAYIYDRDEEFIYLALLQSLPIKIGDKVKFSFIRENDARYSFEGIVEKVFTEMGRTVVAIRHTDKLTRIQLRESIRWQVEIPARFRFGESLEKLNPEEYKGTIEDISVKGVRLCYQGNIPLKEGNYLLLGFSLKNHEFKNIIGRVVYKKTYEKKTCFGVKFEELSRKEEQIIEQFILEEQRKLLRAYKLGEI